MQTLEYVNIHMTEDISVQDIADALNVSRSYLSHEFKKSTGYGLWNYVITKRLVYAQKLISWWCISVTEACYESGFQRLCTFYKKLYKDVWVVHQNNTEKKIRTAYMVRLNL